MYQRARELTAAGSAESAAESEVSTSSSDTDASTESALFSQARHEVYIRTRPLLAFLLRYVGEVIAAGSDEMFQRIVCWLATALRFPDATIETVLVLTGPPGSGETLFVTAIGRLFGVGSVVCAHDSLDDISDATRLVVFDGADELPARCLAQLTDAVTIGWVAVHTPRSGAELYREAPPVLVASSNADTIAVATTALGRACVVVNVSSARVGQLEYFEVLKDVIDSDEVMQQLAEYLTDVCGVRV